MAAPGPDARETPDGLPLRDGYASLVTFVDNPTVMLWEKETTPTGIDNGEPIDQTTFHNTTYATKWPQEISEITDGSFLAAYDPDVEDEIMSLVGNNQEITVTFNDGSTKAIWGYLKSFIPQRHTKGQQPTAEITIVATNMDDSFAEYGPAVASASGT